MCSMASCCRRNKVFFSSRHQIDAKPKPSHSHEKSHEKYMRQKAMSMCQQRADGIVALFKYIIIIFNTSAHTAQHSTQLQRGTFCILALSEPKSTHPLFIYIHLIIEYNDLQAFFFSSSLLSSRSTCYPFDTLDMMHYYAMQTFQIIKRRQRACKKNEKEKCIKIC